MVKCLPATKSTFEPDFTKCSLAFLAIPPSADVVAIKPELLIALAISPAVTNLFLLSSVGAVIAPFWLAKLTLATSTL